MGVVNVGASLYYWCRFALQLGLWGFCGGTPPSRDNTPTKRARSNPPFGRPRALHVACTLGGRVHCMLHTHWEAACAACCTHIERPRALHVAHTLGGCMHCMLHTRWEAACTACWTHIGRPRALHGSLPMSRHVSRHTFRCPPPPPPPSVSWWHGRHRRHR